MVRLFSAPSHPKPSVSGGGGHTSAAVGDIKFYSAGFIHSPGGGEREGEKKEGKEQQEEKKRSRPRRDKLCILVH